MLNIQHQHNNHTTTPHMRVDPTHWGPLSCEGLLCGCCDGVVYESNPQSYSLICDLQCEVLIYEVGYEAA
jgi:hypothetical protein